MVTADVKLKDAYSLEEKNQIERAKERRAAVPFFNIPRIYATISSEGHRFATRKEEGLPG